MNRPREVSPQFPLRTVLRPLLLVTSLVCAPLSASTFTFVGPGSTWATAANWLQDGGAATRFPGAGGNIDDVVIDGAFSVTMNATGVTIGNLSLPATVSASNFTTTLTLSQDLNVNGTVSVLSHTNGALAAQSQLQLNGFFLIVNGGSVTVQGQTLGAITATATLADGSTGALIINGTGALGGSNSNVSVYDLTIGAGATANLASSISIGNTLRVSAFGTLDLLTNTLTIGTNGSSLVVDGTLHSGISGGQLTIPKNISLLSGAGTIDVFNLTLSAGTGSGQSTALLVPTTVRNVLSFAIKHTLVVSTTLTFTGGAGFPLNPLSGSTASLSFSSGAVLVYAESSSTLIDRTFLSGGYQTLRVSVGAAATATVSSGGNTFNGNLEVLSGRLTLTGSNTIGGNVVVQGALDCSACTGSLNVNGGSMTFGGSSVFNAPTTVSLNGNGALTVPSGTIQFNNLNLGGAATTTFSGGGTIRATGALIVAATHVLQGGLTPSDTGTIEIAGSGTSFFLGSSATFLASNLTVRYTSLAATTTVLATPYHNLNIATAIGVASFTSASLVADNVTVESGTLQLNTSLATISNFVSIGSGTLQMASGTMLVGGSWTNSGFFASGTSTVIFNRSDAASQVISASNFNNVTIASAGGAHATGSLTVSGSLLISTALTSDAFTHTIGGDWTNNGVFTPGGSTVVFNGVGRTINGSSATAFDNLTISGGVTVNVAVPPGPAPPPSVTVAGALTLNALVTVNAPRVMAVGAAGSVVRTTGWVVGNLRKTFAAAGTKNFEVGTANGFSPVGVTTTGTGDLTISAIQGPHPKAVGANVLQRYWRITNAGLSSADLTLNYLPADAVGNEGSYLVAVFAGAWSFPSGVVVNANTHVASVTGVTSFGDFTAGERTSVSTLPTHLAITSVNGGSSPVAGSTFPVVVEAQDASGFPAQVVSTTSVALSRAAGTGVLLGTVTGTIAANTSSVTLNAAYFKAESGVAIAAARTAGDALSSGTSSPFTVVPGPAAKLQILLPGQSADPGSGSGFSGTAANQASGVAFMVTVNAVDGFWNLINTATDMVSITSSDPQAILPAGAALLGGTRSFAVTLEKADVATVTAMSNPAPLGNASATLLVVPGAPAAATSTITALSPTVIANGTDASIIRVQVKDAAGNNVTAGGSAVTLATTRGTLTSVTDHSDGTYTSSLTSTTGGTATISGTLNTQPLSNQAMITFTATLSTPFTDDPIVAGVTIVKAIHIIELRDAVNFVRGLAALPPATFTTAVAAGSIIHPADITELRSALAEARVGLPPVTYTDASLTAGTPVKAVHINELRDASRVILAEQTRRAEAKRRLCISGCSGTSAMPDIISFAADPAQIPPGSSTNLLPMFADGVGVITNSHDATAIVTTIGAQVTVSPSTDTTYTLTVTNDAGEQTTRSVAVSVSHPPIVR